MYIGKRKKNLVAIVSFLFLGLFSFCSYAGIVITGTRVIYPSDKKEVSVKLSNKGQKPVLIQSWIDDGNAGAKPEALNVPFILTPPINRIDPGKGQTLRLSYTGDKLPDNQESLFWLNVLEVPAKIKKGEAEGSHLNVAFRTRIKIFFRPVGLPGKIIDAPKKLKWENQREGIKVYNTTPYYITILDLLCLSGNARHMFKPEMIPPFSQHTFKDKKLEKMGRVKNIKFNVINDFGVTTEYQQSID